MKYILKKQGGYIALMATIVISLILLVMAVKASSSGWSARFNVLGTEAKEQANALAEGCAEQALATLLTDPTYTGNITTNTPEGSCHIFPVKFNYPATGLVTINTQAIVRDSYANLDMAMYMNDIHLNSIPTAPTTGTIFVTTHVVNDNGGIKQANNFTIDVSANPSRSFPGSESGEIVIVQPGVYSVNGNNLSNYSMNNSSNCSGSVIAGEIKFCTITYDDITTTLTVLANVINNDGGTKLPSDFPLYIDGDSVTIGTPKTVSAGAHHVSATTLDGYGASSWGYDCDTDGNIIMTLGQNKTCIINFGDAEPPSPSCADTVMMFDRTTSMSQSALDDEETAGVSLIDLYSTVTPLPKISVGSFAGYPDTDVNSNWASIPTSPNGQLQNTYTALKSTLAVLLARPNDYPRGTDLSKAISVANDELNSERHTAGKEKVLLLISDGDPNRPTGNMAFDTGLKSATSNVQNATGELWSTPTGAYSDGVTDSNDPVSENDRHQFYNFGFGAGSGLPAGSSITGIEARVDAWATASTVNTPTNTSESPTNASTPNQWSNANNAFTSNNSYATSSTNGQQQKYSNFGFSIPSNATITGIEVKTEAKTSGGGSPTNTAVLIPSGQGSDNNWNGDESDIDETGSIDCGNGDRIYSSNNNSRESVNIDISSIPNGSTVTQVQIFTWDQRSSFTGGTYQTFVRVDGNVTNSGVNLTTTSTSGCTGRNQTINITDFVKSSTTDLEIGVIKINGSPEVRVGAIRAVVTYLSTAASGSLTVAVSSNNGTTWTTAKNTAIDDTESVDSPSGNSATDLWGKTWIPSDFNDGNFMLSILNNSTTGTTVSLDHTIVNVFYTVPVVSGASCQLGIDLSWNGGSSWSNEKTQTITGIETTYTLGNSSDKWTSWWNGHSWQPSEFSNTNFRARVRAIDPGSGCDNSAVNHLDWLQLKIHYTQNVDPVQAALNAADIAKNAGINIFTIHFGDNPSGYNGHELLANLATGSTSVTGHEDGSLADTASVVTSNTGYISPTLSLATTGGDGNGFEVNPNNAFADGGSYASNINGSGDRHKYYGYNFTIPPNATINGIQTRLDWWLDNTSSTNSLGVELSWDGGTTWTAMKTDTNESTSTSNSRILGSSSDIWGHTWTANNLLAPNFQVRLTSNSTSTTRDFYLDWVPVQISYTVINENSDGDNFFISPTSADMDEIFDYIGEQVCPAIFNVAPPEPSTKGTLTIITQVNSGGSKVASDFTVNVNGDSPSDTSFSGSETGESITLNPGAYSVTENSMAGYTLSLGATCSSSGSSGNIEAGENRVCVLINNPIPPPPLPPDLTLDPSSWHEVPTATP